MKVGSFSNNRHTKKTNRHGNIAKASKITCYYKNILPEGKLVEALFQYLRGLRHSHACRNVASLSQLNDSSRDFCLWRDRQATRRASSR